MIVTDVHIEWDETPPGCWLIVKTDEEDFAFGLNDPAAFYKAVRFEIEPWLREQKAARREFRREEVDHERMTGQHADEDAYEITDPKHPRHHEVMADYADLD